MSAHLSRNQLPPAEMPGPRGCSSTCGAPAGLAGDSAGTSSARHFFSSGLPPERIAVVGDDLESDVAGARAAGMLGLAVRTGKYRPQDEERARQAADVVLDSIAEVPERVYF